MNKFYFLVGKDLYFGYEDEKDAYTIKITQDIYVPDKEQQIFMDFEIDKNGYSVLKKFPEISEILEKINNNEIKDLTDIIKIIENMGFIEEKDDEEINYDLEPKRKCFGDSLKHFLMLDKLF